MKFSSVFKIQLFLIFVFAQSMIASQLAPGQDPDLLASENSAGFFLSDLALGSLSPIQPFVSSDLLNHQSTIFPALLNPAECNALRKALVKAGDFSFVLEGMNLLELSDLDILKHCCNLKTLFASRVDSPDSALMLSRENYTITDKDIRLLSKYCPNLASLYLAGINLTDAAFKQIACDCKNLEVLDVSYSQMDDDLFVEIVKSRPSLKIIHIRGCKKIACPTIKWIKDEYPGLEVIT
jgi:hypothetical protein